MQKYVVHKYRRDRLTRLTVYLFQAEYGNDPEKYRSSLPVFEVDIWYEDKKFIGSVVQRHCVYSLDSFSGDLTQFICDEINKVKEEMEN